MKILYIDNHQDEIDLTVQAIQKAAPDYEIQTVKTIKACLSSIKNDHFDLILSASHLKDGTALDLFKKLTQLVKAPPLVFLTEQDEDMLALNAYKLGAYDYLEKRKGYLDILPIVLERTIYEDQMNIRQEILSQSELSYRTLAENLPGIVYRKNMGPDGKMVFLNNMLEPLTGYKPEELPSNLPFGIDAIILPEDLPTLKNVEKGIKEKTGFQIDYRIRHKNGDVKYFQENGKPVLDPEGKVSSIDGVIFDVTRSRLAENALRSSEERYRRIFEDAVLGFFQSTPEGKILAVNSAYARQFGYELPQDVYKNVNDAAYQLYAHPEKRPKVVELILQNKDRPTIVETEYRRKDGTTFFGNLHAWGVFNEDGTCNRIEGFVEDITEQKNAQEAIRENEVRYSALFQRANDAILILENGVFTDCNDHNEQLFGWPKDKIIGMTPAQLSPEFQTEGVRSDEAAKYHIDQALKNGSEIFQWVHKKSNGESFNAEVGLTRVDLKGKVLLQCMVHDISELLLRKGELEAVSRLSELLRVARTRQEMLPIILNRLKDELKVEDGAIVMKDEGAGEQVIDLAVGDLAPMTGQRVKLGEGIVGKVITSGKPLVVDDIENESQVIFRDLLVRAKAAVSFPLIAQDQILGAISLYRSRQFKESEIRLVGAVAEIAANAFQRSTLFEQMQERMQQMEVQRDIDQAILTSFDLRVTLNILLRHLITTLKVDAADVLLLNMQTQMLEFTAGQGFVSDSVSRVKVRVGEGLAGRVALERKPVFISDMRQASEDISFKPDAFEDLVSYYAIPLMAKGQVKGVLELVTRKPLRMDNEWRNFLETISRQAAIAIESGQMFENLQHTNADLLMAYDATIEGWVRAMDLRDKETEGHTVRVAEVVETLARAMQIRDSDMIHIRRGALLHDMGKLGVPDHILLKPGKLEPDEWEIMKQHPRYAHEMLASIAYLRPALEIPYCHHEKWDGSGYPRGLKGEEIPLAARIFAIVDVWDALRSERPYRKAWTEKKSLKYIKEQSGKHFDPKVVQAFLDLLEKNIVK